MRKGRNMKLNTDYDTDFDELDPEEEAKAVKPVTKVLVFLGLLILSAVICAILWSVTHSDRGENSTDNTLVKRTQESGTNGEQFTEDGRKPGTEAVPEGSGGLNAEAASEEGGKPDSGTASEGSGELDSGTIPKENGEPDLGTTPEGNGGPSSGKGSGSASEPGTAPEESTGDNASDATDSGGSTEQGAMVFTECEDTVTPKEVINLRSIPSTAQADTIVAQVRNGELLSRTGINSDTGWSRVEYNGQTLYAVSGYLTADLAYQPPAVASDPNSVSTKDGRTIVFTDCDDNISPKIYVNLRLEPSTSEGNDTVHCRLEYGEIVHRTGVSEDSGWSRVEYDGAVLYVVTSYMYVVEEDNQ